MGELVTLPEWAEKNQRNAASVRRFWVPRPGFPTPKDAQERVGAGTPFDLFDEDELDAFASRWDAEHRPAPHPMPDDPDSFRTLGAIAKCLGVDGKTVRQYRDLLDERCEHEDRGTNRRTYRTRDVVDVLNSRRGGGVALDPRRDRRRTSQDQT
ncbi:hypothetical protein ACQP2U_42675 (plasmid) [Nocardia sp. CA-084685]|uniref:hypothetical protein n=1 Tax=Nocardia sp. CA-084685 TaxID=3239970 RepID=UPI003D99F1DE